MVEQGVKKGLRFDEKGELRCANCGKLLFCYKKSSRKSQKSVDNLQHNVKIVVKCNRCSLKNEAFF